MRTAEPRSILATSKMPGQTQLGSSKSTTQSRFRNSCEDKNGANQIDGLQATRKAIGEQPRRR